MKECFVIASFALGVGLVAGTIYGRKLEQQIVGKALAEFAAAGRISQSLLASLHARLGYLKKYLGEKF